MQYFSQRKWWKITHAFVSTIDTVLTLWLTRYFDNVWLKVKFEQDCIWKKNQWETKPVEVLLLLLVYFFCSLFTWWSELLFFSHFYKHVIFIEKIIERSVQNVKLINNGKLINVGVNLFVHNEVPHLFVSNWVGKCLCLQVFSADCRCGCRFCEK